MNGVGTPAEARVEGPPMHTEGRLPCCTVACLVLPYLACVSPCLVLSHLTLPHQRVLPCLRTWRDDRECKAPRRLPSQESLPLFSFSLSFSFCLSLTFSRVGSQIARARVREREKGVSYAPRPTLPCEWTDIVMLLCIYAWGLLADLSNVTRT